MGTANYGLWMLATSTLSLMGIAEFGLNTAISKFIAEYVEKKDPGAISTLVSTGILIYLALSIFLILPAYTFSPAIASILKPSETISSEEIRNAIRIMSLGFIPLLLRSGAIAIPVGLQQFKIPTIIMSSYQFVNYAAALIIVLAGGTIADVIMSTVVVLWITAIGSWWIAIHILEPYNFKFSIANAKIITRSLFSFSIMSGISGLGSLIFNAVDRLAVGAVLGLDAVAYYSVIIGVTSKQLQLSGAVTGALMPAVSAWMASGNLKKIWGYFVKSTIVVFGLNFFMASILLLISNSFLNAWLGQGFAEQVNIPFRILVVVYALISLNAPAYYVANGMNNPGINAFSTILGGTLTIGFIFFLGAKYGLTGAAIANGGYLVSWAIILDVYMRLRRNNNQISRQE